MNHTSQSLILIAVMACITMLLRFLPFLLFSKKTPKLILYFGNVLPHSIIAMLIVYCLKETELMAGNHGLPEMISVLLVVALHKWKHNTLLSILSGTAVYMLLVQVVFRI